MAMTARDVVPNPHISEGAQLAPSAVQLCGSFLRGCTHHFCDELHCLAPITPDAISMAAEAESLKRISRRPTVPEDARTNLPRESERLVPLHLIDVIWGHLHLDGLHKLFNTPAYESRWQVRGVLTCCNAQPGHTAL